MITNSIVERFLGFANGLKYRSLFLIVLGVLCIDLLIPDVIPFLDEIVLGLVAIILANWKKERQIEDQQHDVIEGEIVDEPTDKQD